MRVGGAVAKGPGTAGVAGHHPPDRAGVAGAEIESWIEPCLAGSGMQGGQGGAGTHGHLAEGSVHRFDLVKPPQRHHHLVVARNAAAHQPGIAALRNDRHTLASAYTDDTGDLIGVRGSDNQPRPPSVPAAPVALVAGHHIGIGQHIAVADHLRERVREIHEGYGIPDPSTSALEGPISAQHETIFTMEATPVKFGAGSSADAGWELKRLAVSRVLLVTDPGVAGLGHPDRLQERIEAEGIEVVRYDRARVEPTIDSFQDAADFAVEREVDGFVSVGGGSSIDTAKVANLVSTHPSPVMDYVNAPVGEGKRPPGPLKPHLAIPTTSGTGSEATTVAVLDIPDLHVKTGISHRYLRPSQAIVDPELTRSLPAEVTSSTGLDVVCHAAESFLSKPFDTRPAPESPDQRPPYQGANPIADVWSAKALELGGRYLRRAVADGADVEARGFMMLAATMAGVGFGSAGVHIPHACAYPIASLKHVYQPAGYPRDHPFVPHGHSVIVTAPAAFRFTYDAMPERHHRVAELLAGEPLADPGPDTLPEVLRTLMQDVQAPAGVATLGYSEDDVPALVDGALKQQRLLAVAPKEVGARDLGHIITASLGNS
jgi:hydroxyacid-oxoacid transhydrogenase